jgi:hypothetical protein
MAGKICESQGRQVMMGVVWAEQGSFSRDLARCQEQQAAIDAP